MTQDEFFKEFGLMENNCLQFDTDIPALFKYQKSISIFIKDKKTVFHFGFSRTFDLKYEAGFRF